MRITELPNNLLRRRFLVPILMSLAAAWLPGFAAGNDMPATLADSFRTYCFDCHGSELAEGRLNLEAITQDADFGLSFRDWDRVIRVLREQSMPPAEMPQPTAQERTSLADAVSAGIDVFIRDHAGDPGPVLMRRLTSAEYAYTILDLTGLEHDAARGFVSDAVGGEGFTNVGSAQFMQDSTLERYLESAKIVASHAVIGSGPLFFYEHPGTTGRELSAISRIQQIYREHGFRTAAGEGAEPFGLDLYPRAMYVAWMYGHRKELERGDETLAQLATSEGVSVRLCEHVTDVLNREAASFPMSLIVSQFRALPSPSETTIAEVRQQCEQISAVLRDWQSTLAAAAGDEEEASVLTAGDVSVSPTHTFAAAIDWEDGNAQAEFEISVSAASDVPADRSVVVWRNPRLQFRREDRRRDPPRPLSAFVTAETADRLRFGKHPAGLAIGENDFVVTGDLRLPVALEIPAGRTSAQLLVDVELDPTHDPNSIVRCRISDGEVAGETAAEVGESSTLLANPDSPAVAAWQVEVAKFASLLPEVSHREPAPSDRDPIPAPFDNTYNEPERNHFHYAVKYHRDDDFFVQHIADDDTRRRLDQAWTDLLTSFEYHDVNLRFVNNKFSPGLQATHIGDLDQAAIDRLSAPAADYIRGFRDEYLMMQQSLRSAQPGHVADVLEFAAMAWRRPLTEAEQQRLTDFYSALRQEHDQSHEEAIRGTLARVLVAPGFLYRAEFGDTGDTDADRIVPLDDWQLASRLSYLCWSSGPDAALTESAAAGRLQQPEELQRHTDRLLRDPKARRLAAEFFGQWLGFYRFDRHTGVDRQRFPEFTEELQSAMYNEAVSFFEYVLREDRPVDEILFADYAFLNRRLANHYGVDASQLSEEQFSDEQFARMELAEEQHRGGLLGLGAVLTVTSAPLRTSAVKRGDWVLRRIVGTPVPPPPADAGSISADDSRDDGLTIRQQLEAHRDNPACVNCHSRIDALGFALENYDPIGRWRDTYGNGQQIDSSGTLSDGTELSGLPGLRDYLRRQKDNFHRTLCTRLVGYALGRTVMASDRPLIESMLADIDGQAGVADLIVRIVLSEQFRNRRYDAPDATDVE
ncbi:MAG: DUF1592 domain-containing protein [Planctomycetaceae bacterium]